MRAIVQDRYGPLEALALRELERPGARAGEVLVRVRAASVHPDVWHVVCGWPYVLRLLGAGVRRPRNPVPGTDVAGEVVATGAGVTRFASGDAVFGETIAGYPWRNGGAFAEFAAVAQELLAAMPNTVSFAQAAAVPTSGFIALSAVQGRVRPGARVLVHGAAGGVGAFAVQLARAYGAHVTAVDVPAKMAFLRALGADRALDAFPREPDRFDLIVDVPGHRPLSDCRRALARGGTYALVGHDLFGRRGGRLLGSLPRFAGLVALSPFVSGLPGPERMPSKREAIDELRRLLLAGHLRPVVNRAYPLEQAPAALRHLAQGRVCGKVVLTV